TRSPNRAPLPCIRIPTRNTRPEAYTHASVVASIRPMPTMGCHSGTPGGTACRASIKVGVAVGYSEMAVANVLGGSGTTFTHTNNGSIAMRVSGVTIACASFMSVHAAPTAAYSEPYMNTASTW